MKQRAFKFFAIIVGLYHIILGVAALLLPQGVLSAMILLFLGFSPTVNEEFLLISKFTGVYVLAFGAFVLLIARDPERYALLITPVLLLFAVRLINKIVLFDEIGAALDVPTARNLLAVAFVAIFFFGMLFTAPRGFYKVRS